MVSDQLIKQVKFEEGFIAKLYLCTGGKKTIGFGHNLEACPRFKGEVIPDNISKAYAEELLRFDLTHAQDALYREWHGLGLMTGSRHDACVQMAFQLGIAGFMGFKKMRQALVMCDWQEARKQALLSKWAMHDSPARAKRVSLQFVTGEYYQVPS
jgi:lysozyme